MAQQNTIDAAEYGFTPTVTDHTEMVDGIRLHTIDADPGRDIDLFDGDREPQFVGEESGDE